MLGRLLLLLLLLGGPPLLGVTLGAVVLGATRLPVAVAGVVPVAPLVDPVVLGHLLLLLPPLGEPLLLGGTLRVVAWDVVVGAAVSLLLLLLGLNVLAPVSLLHVLASVALLIGGVVWDVVLGVAVPLLLPLGVVVGPFRGGLDVAPILLLVVPGEHWSFTPVDGPLGLPVGPCGFLVYPGCGAVVVASCATVLLPLGGPLLPGVALRREILGAALLPVVVGGGAPVTWLAGLVVPGHLLMLLRQFG